MDNTIDESVALVQLVIEMLSYSGENLMCKLPTMMMMQYLDFEKSFDDTMENLKRNLVKSEIVAVYGAESIEDLMHLVMRLESLLKLDLSNMTYRNKSTVAMLSRDTCRWYDLLILIKCNLEMTKKKST